jgi:GNAT superfamily N-acetyltransferase
LKDINKNRVDRKLNLSVAHECDAAEVTPFRAKHIPFNMYFYKYTALGKEYDYGKNCVTVRDAGNGRFLGFCGAAPVRIQHDFIESVSFWTGDLFVIPEYRGKGLATILYDNAEANHELMLGFGTSDKAFPIKIKRGWVASNCINLYYFRQKSNSASQYLRKKICKLKRFFNRRVVDCTLEYEIILKLDPNKINSLWNISKNHYPNIVIRDYDYINWRYLSSPAKSCYQFLVAKSNDGQKYHAMVILNVSDSLLKIVDYVGPIDNPAIKARLIEEIFNKFPSVDLYQCITSCQHFQACLHSAGFYCYSLKPRFTVLNKNGVRPYSADNWFVMLGDSDGEHIEAMSSCASLIGKE